MTLPASRNYTQTAAAPIQSALINALQDCVIGRKHGQVTIPLDPRKLQNVLSGSPTPSNLNSLSSHFGTDVTASSNPLGAGFTIDGLPFGTRIVNLRVYLKDVAGQPVATITFRGSDRAGSSTPFGTTVSSAASGALQTLALNGINHIVGTTTVGVPFFTITTATNATGTYSIYAIEIDIDKP